MATILSDYYKALKEYQGVEADAFEQSEKDSDDEPDGTKPGFHFLGSVYIPD
jgi:hypothetical protein